ncbi:MAG: nuclear transport factor 2 family protein [Thermoleophilaceae bacterium]|nr:nuclear transport factor 2 family protein [Thermoleophilaceae bacterium]
MIDPALERRIRRAYADFARGDLDAAMAGFAPEAELVNPEYSMEADSSGRDALRESFEAMHAQFEYESLDVVHIEATPRGVLAEVRARATGRGSGVPIDETFTHVLDIRDGRIVAYRWFSTRAEGRAAAGLG